jgi:hypothetical protein
MGDPVADLLARVAAIGGRLAVAGDSVEYHGPTKPLTPGLRAEIVAHKAALTGRLRPRLVPELLARLADHGVYCALTPGGPELRAHPDSDPENADQAVVAELNGRLDELVAFLKKGSADMTDADLVALGFKRGPNGVVMLAAGAPDFDGGWSPPEEHVS